MLEGSLVLPDAPGDAGEAVGEGDSRDVVPAAGLETQGPEAEVIGLIRAPGRMQGGAGAEQPRDLRPRPLRSEPPRRRRHLERLRRSPASRRRLRAPRPTEHHAVGATSFAHTRDAHHSGTPVHHAQRPIAPTATTLPRSASPKPIPVGFPIRRGGPHGRGLSWRGPAGRGAGSEASAGTPEGAALVEDLPVLPPR